MARSSPPHSRLLRLCPLLPLALLAACASSRTHYPSLEIRPAERAFGQAGAAPAADSPPAPAPIPADATLSQRLAALKARANEAAARFTALRPEAERAAAAARGAANGSESWNRAQVALARLDSARSDTAVTLADLDQLAVEADIKAVDQPGPDAESIGAARESVAAIVAGQDAALDSLRG